MTAKNGWLKFTALGTDMTLEEFAKQAGVVLVDCGPNWGGRIGYKCPADSNCTFCGFRSKGAAYKGWLVGTFGDGPAKAVLKLLKEKAK